MPAIRITETVAAPPERVFAIATDLEHAAQVVRGIDSVEVLTPGAFDVGTRWRETRTMMGKQATEEMTVSQFHPGRSYTTTASSCGCEYTSSLTCEKHDRGTLVTMTFEGKPATRAALAVMTLMLPLRWLMLRQARKCLADDLADLRRAAEAGEGERGEQRQA